MSEWTQQMKDAITAYDPSYNNKRPPWERGKKPEEYTMIPGVSSAIDSATQERAMSYMDMIMGAQSEANKQAMEQQAEMLLKLNPQLYRQQQELYREAFPTVASVPEILAQSALSRVEGDTTEAYPIPENIRNLYQQQAIEAGQARGLPVSGASAASEARNLAALGADLRTQDINTLLTLSGRSPTADTQSIRPTNLSIAANVSSPFMALLNQQLGNERTMLGYDLSKRAQEEADNGLENLLGKAVGSIFSGQIGGLGSSSGNIYYGSKVGTPINQKGLSA